MLYILELPNGQQIRVIDRARADLLAEWVWLRWQWVEMKTPTG